MPQDLIRYDLLVQDALKGVVRKVLTDAAERGLPGDHHFYVSFRTGEPGLRMSQRLRDKYPEEMTIILQHQFWDLAVTEHAFEVGLSFSGIPERLLIPFDALTGFFDPSVQFGLKFELSGAEPPDNDEEDGEVESDERPALPPPTPLPLPARAAESRDSARKAAARARTAEAKAGDGKGAETKAQDAKATDAKGAEAKGTEARSQADKGTEPDGKPAGKASRATKDKGKPAEAPGAEVVSLDAFRKKP